MAEINCNTFSDKTESMFIKYKFKININQAVCRTRMPKRGL